MIRTSSDLFPRLPPPPPHSPFGASLGELSPEDPYQDAYVRSVAVDDGDQVKQGVKCDAVRCGVGPTGHQDHELLRI